MSAFGNQRILYKANLYDFHDIGNYYNSVGSIIAHSGTIMGLLFPVDYSRIDDCKQEIIRKLPHLSYVDTVETTFIPSQNSMLYLVYALVPLLLTKH